MSGQHDQSRRMSIVLQGFWEVLSTATQTRWAQNCIMVIRGLENKVYYFQASVFLLTLHQKYNFILRFYADHKASDLPFHGALASEDTSS